MAIKITIEQIDIEQAIKDHIGSMMEIKPDAQLDIDLSATRGSAGFTATILIRNADEVARESNTATTATRPTAQPEPAPEAAPAVTTTSDKVDGRTKAAKALNIPKTNQTPAAPAAEVETITQTSDVQELPAETVTEIQVADVTQEEEAARAADAMDVNKPIPAQEEAEQSAEPAPRASLFGGLTKPKN